METDLADQQGSVRIMPKACAVSRARPLSFQGSGTRDYMQATMHGITHIHVLLAC